MKVRRSDSRLLVVSFPWLMLAFSAIPLAPLGLHKWQGSWRADDWQMVIFCLAMTAVFAAFSSLFLKRSVFDFDLRERRLVWSRRSLWGRKGGVVPFAEIKGAAAARCIGRNGTNYRVEISTLHDGIIPLTDYYAQTAGQCERLVETINSALRTHGDSALEDSILRMAMAGQRTAAIREVAKRYGYDLAQAERFVDQLMT